MKVLPPGSTKFCYDDSGISVKLVGTKASIQFFISAIRSFTLLKKFRNLFTPGLWEYKVYAIK